MHIAGRAARKEALAAGVPSESGVARLVFHVIGNRGIRRLAVVGFAICDANNRYRSPRRTFPILVIIERRPDTSLTCEVSKFSLGEGKTLLPIMSSILIGYAPGDALPAYQPKNLPCSPPSRSPPRLRCHHPRRTRAILRR